MKSSCLHIIVSSLIILLSHAFCCSSQKNPLNNLTTNEEALLAFKSRITSDPHNILANWSTTRSASACTWIGVICSAKHRIISLNLSSYDLEGTIAPHIANLTFLHSIDLSYNHFEGRLPDQFTNLRRLKEINVAENNLTGNIPSWISSFSQLRVLILHNNVFTGTIPNMFNLSKLEILIMSHNLIHGNIPQEMGNLSRLQSLELMYNHLTGFIPPGIFNVSSLVTFDITSNNVSGTLPTNICDNLPVFTNFFVQANQLSGSVPSNIHKCRALNYLSLSFNQFNGRIPREIGELTRLKRLYLGMNNFEGGLPEEIGNLTRLEIFNNMHQSLQTTGGQNIPFWIFNMSSLIEIDLSYNGLVGNFPPHIHHDLPNLELLYLHYNLLSGQILPTLLDSKKLSLVQLRSNHFTGPIPKQLGNLTELKILILRENNMIGKIPSELGKLNLEVFSVQGNKLSGPIPDSIFNISTLIELDLSDTQIPFTGQLPENIGHTLPNLQGLYLNYNGLTGPIPTSITNMSKLEIISMSGNSLTGPVPDFGRLTSLKSLVIAENNLTGDLGFLTSCRYLEMFDISLNQFNAALPPSIGNLSNSLKNFRAFDCLLKGSIPLDIGNLSLLEALVLDGNKLTGLIPNTLGKLKQLGVIYLEHNRLQGPIPSDLCGLSSLVDLYLSGNMLNGTIPSCLGEAKSVRRLFLDSNRFASEVPSLLWNLTDLWGLNLSSNFLTGALSSEIATLKALVDLDLSWNRFSGDIPVSIGSMSSLVTLSLSHNELVGSVPQSFGGLHGLEHLDLSNNNLSGTIPKSLEALANLGYLNLSYNRLDGEIPTGGHFKNFTSQSFMHNHALCGVARLSVPLCRIRYHKRFSSKQVAYLIVVVIASAIFAVAMMVWLIRRKNVNGLRSQVEISPNSSWRRVSYQELVQATDDFSEANALGSGSFGSVFKGKLSVDELDVAVKVFNLQTEHAIKSFDVECEVMSNIRHRHLVRVLSCCSNVEFKALVLEYMPNGSLERWLYSHNYSLDLLQRLDIAIDVALALEYLHHGNMFPVVHCDLKPSNVLLDQDMIAHVSDFGIAKLFGEGDVTFQTITLATVGYMAPEYGSEGIVSTSGDVYSYGIMLLEIFTRKRPTDDMFEGEMDLKHWVSEALQQNEMGDVVAPGLLESEDEHLVVKELCIYSIFDFALKCSATSPEERLNMTQSVVVLKKIKATFLASTRRNQTVALNH